MNALNSAQRRSARMAASYNPDELLSERTYNMILCGVVLAGLLVNYVMCLTCGPIVARMNPILFIVGYIVCVIAGTMIAVKSDDPLVSLVGYALVVVPVGLVVTSVVTSYGGFHSRIVTTAFMMTAIITASMTGFSIAFPEFFRGLGKMLLSVLIGLLICELICLLFHVQQTITSWIAAGVFSLYIGYDFQRSQMFPKTADNAVDCALDIYLDIINLFLRILRILGSKGSSSKSKF